MAGEVQALRRLAVVGTALTGIDIQNDILYGPRQVRALVDAAAEAGVRAAWREIGSSKGDHAFLANGAIGRAAS